MLEGPVSTEDFMVNQGSFRSLAMTQWLEPAADLVYRGVCVSKACKLVRVVDDNLVHVTIRYGKRRIVVTALVTDYGDVVRDYEVVAL